MTILTLNFQSNTFNVQKNDGTEASGVINVNSDISAQWNFILNQINDEQLQSLLTLLSRYAITEGKSPMTITPNDIETLCKLPFMDNVADTFNRSFRPLYDQHGTCISFVFSNNSDSSDPLISDESQEQDDGQDDE